MTEINTREIATSLMLDAARRVPDFTITDRVYAEAGGPDEGDMFIMAGEVRDLIDKATVTVSWDDQDIESRVFGAFAATDDAGISLDAMTVDELTRMVMNAIKTGDRH